jgi:hypothetical protein
MTSGSIPRIRCAHQLPDMRKHPRSGFFLVERWLAGTRRYGLRSRMSTAVRGVENTGAGVTPGTYAVTAAVGGGSCTPSTPTFQDP